MELQVYQIVLLTLYGALALYDGNHTTMGLVKPSMAGFIAGLIMGDVQTGLIVGGTLNLLVLGVGNFGGASIPDYMTGAVLGTVFAVLSGQGAEFGIVLAIPIGLLMIKLDILGRFCNVFFLHSAERHLRAGNLEKAALTNLLGLIPTSLSRAVPILLALVFGSVFVQNVVNHIPQGIMNGLRTSGGMLPAVGIAILLKYLPIKRNLAFLILGFVLAAYLTLPMLAVALIGLVAALLFLDKNSDNNKSAQTNHSTSTMGDE
jgi:PTS system mannose-specific IIC component